MAPRLENNTTLIDYDQNHHRPRVVNNRTNGDDVNPKKQTAEDYTNYDDDYSTTTMVLVNSQEDGTTCTSSSSSNGDVEIGSGDGIARRRTGYSNEIHNGLVQPVSPTFHKRIKKKKPNHQSINCIQSLSLSSSSSSYKQPLLVHPTISLPLLVLIDMFAVSLVIPLLFQYYQRAGIHSANQRELLSSVFSCAQIIGGLSLGVLTDMGAIQRRTLLLLSFGGSALSYAFIIYGGLSALIISRILIGLVKHTMTVVITILTKITTPTDRAKHMGRVSASSTVAWIVGPSVGALLFKYVDHRAPALLACALFILNMFLVVVLLRDDDHMEQYMIPKALDHNLNEQEIASKPLSTSTKSKGLRTMITNVRTCFSSKVLGAVVLTKILLTWVGQTTNYSSLGSFYEDMYGLEPHHRGYISSYQQALQFIVQSFLVERVLHWVGGERKTICIFTALTTLAVVLEAKRSLSLFLIVLCPLISLSFSMTNLSLQTLITHVAPTDAIFSVLAALDVLSNIAHVSVPFYRTALFQFLRPKSSTTTITTTMVGDPDPVAWVLSAGLHWFLAAIFVAYIMLVSNHKEWEQTENAYRKQHASLPQHHQQRVKKGK